jgi:DNA transformation protein
MFGGHGLFRDGLMIGLVADEVLFFKVDGESEPRFIEQGLPPFQFQRGEKVVSMSYRQAPEAAMDNAEAMTPWARQAMDAATRAAARKKRKR